MKLEEIYEDLIMSYKKFKSMALYSTNIIIRKEISNFENEEYETFKVKYNEVIDDINEDFIVKHKLDLEKKIALLSYIVLNYINNDKCIKKDELENFIKKSVDLYAFPKSINYKNNDDYKIIDDVFGSKTYDVDKISYFINIPIEFHILGVYWVILVGNKLQNTYIKYCYGNILYDKEIVNDKNDKRLFKKYYSLYSEWRDNGIDRSKSITEMGQGVSIICLDIKDYYYNVKLSLKDFKNFESKLSESKEKYNQVKDKELNNNENKINVFKKINHIIKLILESYSKFFQFKYLSNEETYIGFNLPLDFAPSTILANWYLKDFDKDIIKQLNPVYYGRYVDDMMIVLPKNEHMSETDMDLILKRILDISYEKEGIYYDENSIFQCIKDRKVVIEDENISSIAKFLKAEKEIKNNERIINDNFEITKETIKKLENIKVEKKYQVFKLLGFKSVWRIKNKTGLFIQSEKIKIYNLQGDKYKNKFILDKFIREMQYNSSEFRLLPENTKVISKLYNDVYTFKYDKNGKSLRSIEKIKIDKYNLSIFLSNLIMMHKFEENDFEYSIEICAKLEEIFKFSNLIEYYTMWEKLLIFLVMINMDNCFKRIINRIEYQIDKLEINLRNDQTYQFEGNQLKILTKSLKDFLEYCILSAKSLCKFDDSNADKIKQFRKTNMFRYPIISNSLINYTGLNNNNISFINRKSFYFDCCESVNYKMNYDLIKYSPKFIHLHEWILYHIDSLLKNDKLLSGTNYISEAINDFKEYINDAKKEELEKAIKIYELTNYNDNEKKELEKIFFENDLSRIKNIVSHELYYMEIKNILTENSNEKIKKLRIALANKLVNMEDNNLSVLNKPNLSMSRYEKLSKSINEAIKEKANIMIFPEISIPYAWIDELCNISRKEQIAFVFGLEHIPYKNKKLCNYVVTIIPFQVNGYKSAIVKFRLKNYYSPNEKSYTESYFKDYPKKCEEYNKCKNKECKIAIEPNSCKYDYKITYDLFNWMDIYFTVYNCFELADILDRGIFKGYLDLIISCVHNQDVNYYKSIMHTTTRDLHCYSIEANNSEKGPSRVFAPKGTACMEIGTIKSDIDSVLFVDIDLKELRDFQIRDHNYQMQNKAFKPTPPNFQNKNIKENLDF